MGVCCLQWDIRIVEFGDARVDDVVEMCGGVFEEIKVSCRCKGSDAPHLRMSLS